MVEDAFGLHQAVRIEHQRVGIRGARVADEVFDIAGFAPAVLRPAAIEDVLAAAAIGQQPLEPQRLARRRIERLAVGKDEDVEIRMCPERRQPRTHRRDPREGRWRVLVVDRHQDGGAAAARAGPLRDARGAGRRRPSKLADRAPRQPEHAGSGQHQPQRIERRPAVRPRQHDEQPGAQRRRDRAQPQCQPSQGYCHSRAAGSNAAMMSAPAQPDQTPEPQQRRPSRNAVPEPAAASPAAHPAAPAAGGVRRERGSRVSCRPPLGESHVSVSWRPLPTR